MATNLAVVKNTSLISRFASKFSVDEAEVMNIIKSTAFKQRDGSAPTDNQMMALLIVADQYGLNPFVKEIYAYPDKSNGIVPVVGVDGWSRIMNDHPQMDGIEFRYSEEKVKHKGKDCNEWIECVIYRKDRTKPIVVREYFDEVVRSTSFATPWDTHPKRMHRHKAEIQCTRIAFGFAGIYDEDEAQRILEKDVTSQGETLSSEPQAKAYYTEEVFSSKFQSWADVIQSGKKTPESLISFIESKGTLFTENQKSSLKGIGKKEVVQDAEVVGEMAVNSTDDFLNDYEESEAK